MKHFFAFCLSLACKAASAQGAVSNFQVLDSATHQPLPYATVKSVSAPTGTYTNNVGAFVWSQASADTVLVSSIGYISRQVVLHALPQATVLLRPEYRELAPVSILRKKLTRLDTLGIRNVPDLITYGSDLYTFEMAQKIRLPRTNDGKVYRLRKVIIAASRYTDEVPVLLHVYDRGSDGMPGTDLLLTKTLLRKADFDKKRKEFVVNLESEQVLLTDSVCFISLEWLPHTFDGHYPRTIGVRLTDAVPENLTYVKGAFPRETNNTAVVPDKNWTRSSMVFPLSTPWLKRPQLYGTNLMIAIEVGVLE